MILMGLRADNLPGWLAALGVARILGTGLRWAKKGPLCIAEVDYDGEDIVQRLLDACKEPTPALAVGLERGLRLERDEYLAFASQYPEWAAAFFSDDGTDLLRSPLLMSSGGSRQHPVTMVEQLTQNIAEEDIAGAIRGPWIRRNKYGLRLDPVENREHADQWVAPTNDPKPNVAWGPSRLAWEGLPLVPCTGRDARSIFDKRGRLAQWPVWERYASGRAITAVILSTPPTYQCNRWHVDKGNYSVSPARPV